MRRYILILLVLMYGMAAMAKEYHYKYTDNCSKAYNLYLSLQPEKGKELLRKELIADPYNLMATYISDYDDCLLMLFNGNTTDYEQLKHHQGRRLALMERGDEQSPWFRFCKAGLYMHWAFVHLRYGENLKAASNFRRSFLLLKENKRLFPSFAQNDVFLGIEEATVGALPDNYKWIASIFGMKGDVKSGVAKVKKFIDNHNRADALYAEALVYYAYLNYYILSDKDEAWSTVSSQKFVTENNLLNCFVKANIAINYRKANAAINVLKQAEHIDRYELYPIFDYEYGYALVYKQDKEAITRFNSFLKNYSGRIFVKDAWQKLSYTYYLQGNSSMAEYCKGKIVQEGTTDTDSDKQAMRFASQGNWPDDLLLKAQLLTDGGYYEDAFEVLSSTRAERLNSLPFELEYYFRMARVNDELNKKATAIEYYNKTIKLGRDRQEQFAARSALQLGFLYEKQALPEKAIDMFQLALSMKSHDFKNSIDQQAKAGINRLSK